MMSALTCKKATVAVASECTWNTVEQCWQGDTVNNTTRSFVIDVIIRKQDIKKLETKFFGLTLAIFRFYLEKPFCEIVIQLCKRANAFQDET